MPGGIARSRSPYDLRLTERADVINGNVEMTSLFHQRLQALEDAYYAVTPARRQALVQRCLAAIGRHLVPDHQVLRDFDMHQHTFGPRSLANIAAGQGIRYFRPWECVTHLFRSVAICEFMLSYWLVLQRWLPRRVLNLSLVLLTLGCNAWRRDLARQAACEANTVRFDPRMIPLVLSHVGEPPVAVNVNQRGWGWMRPAWWKVARSETPRPAVVDLLPYALAVLLLLSLVVPDQAMAGVLIAALNAAVVWEVRTTGVDTNSGGFKAGATGTDWSQQNATQYAVTDGVTAGTTTITSATANFGTDVVGNVMYVTGGTGAVVADWYEITARASSVSITVDRSTGLTAGTGVTLNIGGALLSPAIVAGKLVGGHKVHIKAATYSIASVSPNVVGGRLSITVASRWEGYQTTRNDLGNPPVLQASGISTATICTFDANNSIVTNVSVDGALCTAICGFSTTGGQAAYYLQCVASNCTNTGFSPGSGQLDRCRATGCTTVSPAILINTSGNAWNCVSHGNTVTGFQISVGEVLFCLSYGNTGAASDGFEWITTTSLLLNCTSYGNGRDGFRSASGGVISTWVNCLAENNGGYGFTVGGSATSLALMVNCGGYNNTSGNVTGSPYVNSGFVTGTGSFFTNAAAGDFSLNNTAGAGAAARAVGIPGLFPGGLTTGYLDIGAAQHADPAGGGGGGGSIFGGGSGSVVRAT